MRGLERAQKSMKEEPKAETMEMMITGRESQLNFTMVVERDIQQLTMTGTPEADARIRVLRSLSAKLNLAANRSDKSTDPTQEFSNEERAEYYRLRGNYQRGLEDSTVFDKSISAENIGDITGVLQLSPHQQYISGVIDNKDKDVSQLRITRGLKTLAYANPDRYRVVMKHLEGAGRFVRKDIELIDKLYGKLEQFGVSKRQVVEALESANPREVLVQRINDSMLGSRTLRERFDESWARLSVESWFTDRAVIEYQSRGAEREEFIRTVDSAIRDVFVTPGASAAVFFQEVTDPKGPPESKRAFDNLEHGKKELQNLLGDKARFEAAAKRRFEHDPMWVHRDNPTNARNFAREMVEAEAREAVGNGGGGFWGALWQVFSSLMGTAYNQKDIDSAAAKMQGMA